MKRSILLVVVLAVLVTGSLSALPAITGDLLVHGNVLTFSGGWTYVQGGVEFVFLNSMYSSIGSSSSGVWYGGAYAIGTGNINFTGNNTIGDVRVILIICQDKIVHTIEILNGNLGPFKRDIYVGDATIITPPGNPGTKQNQ